MKTVTCGFFLSDISDFNSDLSFRKILAKPSLSGDFVQFYTCRIKDLYKFQALLADYDIKYFDISSGNLTKTLSTSDTIYLNK